MSKCIERITETKYVDPAFPALGTYEEWQDVPTTIERVETVAGKRLDRRRSYAVIGCEVHRAEHWTQECSGCYGNGCGECGYTGKCRVMMWQPIAWHEETHNGE